MASVAIVGMACCYPDARSPSELWENTLAQRRAFRRIPDERLRIADYFSQDGSAPDCTYSQTVAVIEGYEFDRIRFRVSGSTFRTVDLTHWLALDVVSEALRDAGFPDASGLPREISGVFIGNTLTGEFARANVMRLRWPYVRRVLEAGLVDKGWPDGECEQFLDAIERRYKSSFPPVGEETLPGGMSNTIAGRICNHFDLKGGGYTVDAACASSLLSIAHACAALEGGDLDVAIAGGVDLSLDPFELVGFAKAGALAKDEMRVFDEHSCGFWPGEGCGMVVLMRTADAVRQHKRVYAIVRGWGVSSDGSGGITRPEVEGQLLAIRRAYRRAGFGIDTVGYLEAHGTGTPVGDDTELTVLSRARQEVGQGATPAVLSAIKGNIGHTKAAAGIAGLIKAAMALHERTLPPITGCPNPHRQLSCADRPALKILRCAEPWPENEPLRAGISAMGFGGINTHVVLEGSDSSKPRRSALPAPGQDAELFLFAAEHRAELVRQLERVCGFAARLAESELADLAAELQRQLTPNVHRAALIASSADELQQRLERLISLLRTDSAVGLSPSPGVFFGTATAGTRFGLLFPGQGSPAHLLGGMWRHRFECVAELYSGLEFPDDVDSTPTEVAQPAILRATIAGLRLLRELGLMASVAVGHSLGELSALHWAGSFNEECLLRMGEVRGQAMAAIQGPAGEMASIYASQFTVEELINGDRVSIAGLNSRSQTVISGDADAVTALRNRAQSLGLKTAKLAVSHAFHSPLVAEAKCALEKYLATQEFLPLRKTVISTVTGDRLGADTDLRALILNQITQPVRFLEAFERANQEVDLWIEVGPGSVLSHLAQEISRCSAVPVDACGSSVVGLLSAAAAAFATGVEFQHEALFRGRLLRSFDLNWRPKFFSNPCESAPVRNRTTAQQNQIRQEVAATSPLMTAQNPGTRPLDVVRQLVVRQTELPVEQVNEELRFLSDLHLNSIVVGQIVTEAARLLGLPPPVAVTQYADAKISELVEAFEELVRVGIDSGIGRSLKLPPGVDNWVRCFQVAHVERPRLSQQPVFAAGTWKVFLDRTDIGSQPFRRAFENASGNGVCVILPSKPNFQHARMLLAAAQELLTFPHGNRFVIVERGGGGGAFARTLHLERPGVPCCVLNVPESSSEAAAWAVSEALATVGYSEAHYDSAGIRRVPSLEVLPLDNQASTKAILSSNDVLLVTGGGKGITAECALSVARNSGARLAILGRSVPESDSALNANLDRFSAFGIALHYIATDVSDLKSVKQAVEQAESTLGCITAVLHGAAANVPQLIPALDDDTLERTLKPKITGFDNLLSTLSPEQLRLVVTFGSLIAHTGLPGEAAYGLANEWLRVRLERWKQQHPSCRCLHVDWSVWSGAGMGDRLANIDLLAQYGITPIPLDEGTRVFEELLQRDVPNSSVVVSGRMGNPPTLAAGGEQLPFLRFLENVRFHLPGVELITEAQISTDSDLYLNDHIFEHQRILPAVIGVEAMAQNAMALLRTDAPPVFEDVLFQRPVVIPENGSVTIRIAALVTGPGCCRVVLRSSETAFQVDHFRALCRIRGTAENPRAHDIRDKLWDHIPLDPECDLYGEILFHTGRFRRLGSFHLLRAKECIAEIRSSASQDWFYMYLPPELVLGDPGARDACVHAVQACIPESTLLPVAVEKIVTSQLPFSGTLVVYARERDRGEDTFLYDLSLTDEDGWILEEWIGVRLQRVRGKSLSNIRAAPLWGPYLERRVQDVNPQWEGAIVVESRNEQEGRGQSDRAMRRAIGSPAGIVRTPSGKPQVLMEHRQASVAHCSDLIVAIADAALVSCDVEEIADRNPHLWIELLGPEGAALAELIAAQTGTSFDRAATRVWAATECLLKLGCARAAPLTLETSLPSGTVSLRSGCKQIVSLEAKTPNGLRTFAFLSSR